MTGVRNPAWAVVLTDQANEVPTIAEVEAQHIKLVLAYHAGNMTRAAKALGIDRRTLYRKVRGKVSSDSR